MSTATDSRRSRTRDAVRLVLVDRDALARRAMREELTASGEFVVAAEAAEEDDAIASVRRERPDLVLIDIGYPRLEGIPIAKELRRRIESDLQYPSTIKITVIREARYTETAT